MGGAMRSTSWLPILLGFVITFSTITFAKIHILDGEHVLGESTEVHMKVTSKDGVKRMWTKMDGNIPPRGTVTYKTLQDVEEHGKCRFACYSDKLCGGYAYTPAHKTCKLLSAPNFLTSKAENDAW